MASVVKLPNFKKQLNLRKLLSPLKAELSYSTALALLQIRLFLCFMPITFLTNSLRIHSNLNCHKSQLLECIYFTTQLGPPLVPCLSKLKKKNPHLFRSRGTTQWTAWAQRPALPFSKCGAKAIYLGLLSLTSSPPK